MGSLLLSIKWTPLFEWYIAKLVVMHEFQIEMWYDEIRLGGQNILTILVQWQTQ